MQKINDLLLGAYIKMQSAANNFMKKENGEANIIAIILVLVIVIALVLLFRDSIEGIVDNILDDVESQADAANFDVNRK